MIHVREAEEQDVEAVREIFRASYGSHYAYPQYCDVPSLKKMVFDDDTLLLVAEDDGAILGTASVIFDTGAFGDLLGEFGRLAVHPDGRGKGIGNLLMEKRLELVRDRLHMAIVDNRVAHTKSQQISASHGFKCVGFLPKKLLFSKRESLAMYARHFDAALQLRKNNPRIIPEAYALAEAVLKNFDIPCDLIVDEEAAAYAAVPVNYQLERISSHGYSSLLRFERGRISHREIFGPVRLHMGWFKIRTKQCSYLMAREGGRLVGAIGFLLEPYEKTAAVVELITLDEKPTRFLLDAFERKCREDWDIKYIETDVSAHAPAMQRTLLELGFLPAAYLPAMVFDRVERLDGIRMVRLNAPLETEGLELDETAQPIADLVLRQFEEFRILPDLEEELQEQAAFAGMSREQIQRIIIASNLKEYEDNDTIFKCGAAGNGACIILDGQVSVYQEGKKEPTELLKQGEFVGEVSMLNRAPHHCMAKAKGNVRVLELNLEKIKELIRLRPGVGVQLYKNIARGLGRKLYRAFNRADRGVIHD